MKYKNNAMKKGLIFFIFCLLLLSASSFASDSPLDVLLNGKTSLDKGDYENAAIQLSEAYERFPFLGDYILFWRAKAFEGKGDSDNALKDINTIKKAYKDSLLIKNARRMELEILKDKDDKLSELFEGFIKEYPSEFNVMYAYAVHLKERSESEKAKKIFRDIFVSASLLSEKARNELSDGDIKTDDLIKRGENLNSAWMFKEAEESFNAALKKAEQEAVFIDSPEKKAAILEGIAYSLFRQKRYKEAVQLYSRTKNDYWHARSLLRARDIASFESRLSDFIKTGDKRFAPLLISYGTMKRREGDTAGALKILNNALSIYPSEKENILWSIGWTHYMSKNLKDACNAFSQLYKTYGSSKYLYWKNRCSEKLNGKPAAKTLSKKSAEGDFYIFLPMLMNMDPAQTDIKKISSLNLDTLKPVCKPIPIFERADILSEIGLKDDAANELMNLSKKAASSDELFSISCRLKNLDKYKSAISLASRIPHNEESREILYPLAYADEVAEASKENNIDPLLILSVMREESRFDPNARSIAGAIGLLQLMPETAFRLIKKIPSRLKNADELYSPVTNIMIGSYYLKSLLQEFESLPLAIASYNAGESAVREWIKKGGYSSVDEFIEDIPYDETKNYVKKVITSYFGYKRRLDSRQTVDQQSGESM